MAGDVEGAAGVEEPEEATTKESVLGVELSGLLVMVKVDLVEGQGVLGNGRTPQPRTRVGLAVKRR